MSNETTVTPYESVSDTNVSMVASCATGLTTAALAVVQLLAGETPEERAALDRAAERQCAERRGLRQRREPIIAPSTGDTVRVTSATLHVRDTESLLRSAERQGFVRESASAGSAAAASTALVLLTGRDGTRLVVSRNRDNRVVLHSAGSFAPIQSVLHRYTMDRALEHFERKGMRVQKRDAGDEAAEIRAQEQGASLQGGAAKLTARVRPDGTTDLDIDEIRGARCEQIAEEFTRAVEGRAFRDSRKPAYWQLPGEPRKTRVRI